MEMKSGRNWLMATGILLSVFIALTCYAAYTHNGETDSQNFRNVYPQAVGTKLDSCALCHKGAQQWEDGRSRQLPVLPHLTTAMGQARQRFADTLNPYGLGILRQWQK